MSPSTFRSDRLPPCHSTRASVAEAIQAGVSGYLLKDASVLELINAARQVVFLVEGAAKAEMLANVLHGPYQPDVWPAQLIGPAAEELHWLVDSAAAARLPKG